MRKLILLCLSLMFVIGCTPKQNKVEPIVDENGIVTNYEEFCYSEKEIWEEFEKRGFKEENITKLNFFGEQDPSTIYTDYNMDFESESSDVSDFSKPAEKDSEEKHPEYNFLYITGDFQGYLEDTQELIMPLLYGGENYGFWSISIAGNSWVAFGVPGGFEVSENDEAKVIILCEKSPNFQINNNLTAVDYKEEFMKSEEYLAHPDRWVVEEVDLITEEVLSQYAKKYQPKVEE